MDYQEIPLSISPDDSVQEIIEKFQEALRPFGITIANTPIEKTPQPVSHCQLCGQIMNENPCPHPAAQQGRHLA